VQTLGRTLLKDYKLPLQMTAPPYGAPPLTDRSAPTYAFDPHLRTPYYMNWNVTIQRQISTNLIFEARYVGNRGRKLIRNLDVNEVNIFENGFLDAFNITRSGGNSALLDQMWLGFSAAGGGRAIVRSE